MPQARFAHLNEAARKWRMLADGRFAHFVELFQTGRWKRYFSSEEDFLNRMREAMALSDRWAEIAPLQPSAELHYGEPTADAMPGGDVETNTAPDGPAGSGSELHYAAGEAVQTSATAAAVADAMDRVLSRFRAQIISEILRELNVQ